MDEFREKTKGRQTRRAVERTDGQNEVRVVADFGDDDREGHGNARHAAKEARGPEQREGPRIDPLPRLVALAGRAPRHIRHEQPEEATDERAVEQEGHRIVAAALLEAVADGREEGDALARAYHGSPVEDGRRR